MRSPAVVAAMIAVGVAGQVFAQGVTSESRTARAAVAAPSGDTRAAKKPPRTPWGTPDLQGQWTGSTITPLERPARFKDKAVLSVEEARALELEARKRAEEEPQVDAGDPGTYNQVWFDPAAAVVSDRRTSLIVDPPDGRLPLTPEGRRLSQEAATHYGRGARDNPEDFDTGERCLTDGLPLPYWTGYNNNYLIIQTPQHVILQAEMFHDVRIIPIDGRPRINQPQWLGESRGRWEGNTLVVETESFADKSKYWYATSWRQARPTLKLVERFTRVDDETLDYEFTMTDPVHFTRPWTARLPLSTSQASRGVTEGPLYEYACHEGNFSIVNVLRGARLQGDLGAAAPAPR